MVWYEQFYTYIKYTLYILFVVSFLELNKYAPTYMDELRIVIKTFICLFLLYRFNPLRKVEFTEFDRVIVFDSALYLLSTTLFISLFELLNKKVKYIDDKIKNIKHIK